MILWQRKRMLYHTQNGLSGNLTFYNYGTHQEGFAHVLRYLKDSIDNKPDQEKISGFEKMRMHRNFSVPVLLHGIFMIR